MDRRRKKEPLCERYCLSITKRQKRLLQEYAHIRGFKSEVAAVRHMINGLEAWLDRQRASVETETDVEEGEHQLEESIEGQDDEWSTSLPDFGGRPHIGLPGTAGNWDDGT